MKIVAISDTHYDEYQLTLPKGDILIHCGDFDIRDLKRLEYINSWFGKLDFNKESIEAIFTNAIYLENSSITINGIKIWGSPYTPIFKNWAYMRSGDELKKLWETIPNDTDIIITHGQPLGINDYVEFSKQNVGCPFLRDKIKEIKPKYYIGGHLHGANGIYKDENTIYINCSLMNEKYEITNKPIELEF